MYKGVLQSLLQRVLFLSAVIKNVQVVRGLRKGKDQGRVVQGNIVADQSNKS
jgi:hypothetical protein